jgi:hypothetical protein
MKRLLLVLVILCATTAPGRADDLLRNAGQSCFFGAAVLGGSAAVVLYSAAAGGATTLPITALVISNTIFGCGLGILGSVAAYGFGALYDRLVPPETPLDELSHHRGSDT